MPKATPHVQPESRKLNRRTVLARGASIAAAAAASTAPALSALAAQPSPRADAFALTGLGRGLHAAILDYQAHIYLDPESGQVGELRHDEAYIAAWGRLWRIKSDLIDELTAAIQAQPLSLANLADRAMIAHTFTDEADRLAACLPGAAEERDDGGWDGRHNELLAAAVAMLGLPLVWPCEAWDADNGPPDAQKRIAAMRAQLS